MPTFNPFETQSSLFTIYKPREISKVEKDYPIHGKISISGAKSILPDGTIIFSRNTPKKEEIVESVTSVVPMSWETMHKEYVPQNNLFSSAEISDKVGFARNFFQNKLYEEHKNRGKSDEEAKQLAYIQSAGILGNFMTESGDINLNTSAIGDYGKSFGVGQWNGSRRKNLETFAKELGKDSTDLETQIRFAWQEMTDKKLGQTSFKILENLLKTKTAESAAEVFMRRFERPSVPHLKHRQRNAKLLI